MIENDDLFDALADGQRRKLLVSLLTHDRHHVSKLSGASRQIADANDALLAEYLDNSREMAGVDMDLLRKRHVHLPKLDDHGFVEWDRDAHLVTKGPRFDEMKPILELLDDHWEDRETEDPPILLRR